MKRDPIEQAAERLARAKMDYDATVEAELVRRRVGASEPANRRIVRFSGSFVDGGTTYSFVAIRADHYRGDRRWFVSQNNIIDKPVVLRSPATWVELVRFAVPGSIYVAPLESGWRPIAGLPTGEGLRNLDAPDASSRVQAPRLTAYDPYAGIGLQDVY